MNRTYLDTKFIRDHARRLTNVVLDAGGDEIPKRPQRPVILPQRAVYKTLTQARNIKRKHGVVLHKPLLVSCEEAEESQDEGRGAEQRGENGGRPHVALVLVFVMREGGREALLHNAKIYIYMYTSFKQMYS